MRDGRRSARPRRRPAALRRQRGRRRGRGSLAEIVDAIRPTRRASVIHAGTSASARAQPDECRRKSSARRRRPAAPDSLGSAAGGNDSAETLHAEERHAGAAEATRSAHLRQAAIPHGLQRRSARSGGMRSARPCRRSGAPDAGSASAVSVVLRSVADLTVSCRLIHTRAAAAVSSVRHQRRARWKPSLASTRDASHGRNQGRVLLRGKTPGSLDLL